MYTLVSSIPTNSVLDDDDVQIYEYLKQFDTLNCVYATEHFDEFQFAYSFINVVYRCVVRRRRSSHHVCNRLATFYRMCYEIGVQPKSYLFSDFFECVYCCHVPRTEIKAHVCDIFFSPSILCKWQSKSSMLVWKDFPRRQFTFLPSSTNQTFE